MEHWKLIVDLPSAEWDPNKRTRIPMTFLNILVPFLGQQLLSFSIIILKILAATHKMKINYPSKEPTNNPSA